MTALTLRVRESADARANLGQEIFDIAVRGLEVGTVVFLINYNFPTCNEDYAQRIERFLILEAD